MTSAVAVLFCCSLQNSIGPVAGSTIGELWLLLLGHCICRTGLCQVYRLISLFFLILHLGESKGIG